MYGIFPSYDKMQCPSCAGAREVCWTRPSTPEVLPQLRRSVPSTITPLAQDKGLVQFLIYVHFPAAGPSSFRDWLTSRLEKNGCDKYPKKLTLSPHSRMEIANTVNAAKRLLRLKSTAFSLSTKLGKWYLVKHKCVIWGVFNRYVMNNHIFFSFHFYTVQQAWIYKLLNQLFALVSIFFLKSFKL